VVAPTSAEAADAAEIPVGADHRAPSLDRSFPRPGYDTSGRPSALARPRLYFQAGAAARLCHLDRYVSAVGEEHDMRVEGEAMTEADDHDAVPDDLGEPRPWQVEHGQAKASGTYVRDLNTITLNFTLGIHGELRVPAAGGRYAAVLVNQYKATDQRDEEIQVATASGGQTISIDRQVSTTLFQNLQTDVWMVRVGPIKSLLRIDDLGTGAQGVAFEFPYVLDPVPELLGGTITPYAEYRAGR
jgi:hypothetical protein